MKVAVVAHSGKTFGDGLAGLRAELAKAGVKSLDWHEVKHSRKAHKAAKKAVDAGADVLFVWGGDGTVQRCIDAAAGSRTAIAILPAGTANLLATHLGLEQDIARCVQAGLHGKRRPLDVGVVNGERFAVMAGIGIDALLLRAAHHGVKSRLGRLAYLWAGAKVVRMPRFGAKVKVGGPTWFEGPASCVLVGNLGSLFGGLTIFEHARDDDGRLEIGVMTAKGAEQWAEALARTLVGSPGLSPYIELTAGRVMRVRLSRKLPYELDGSARDPTDRLDIAIEPGAIQVCLP